MKNPIVCVGSALVDELFFSKESILPATSNPAESQRYVGGVITNIARHLALLGESVQLITYLGDDSDAQWICKVCTSDGIDMSASIVGDVATGKYVSLLNPDGSLFSAVSVDQAPQFINAAALELKQNILAQAGMIITDTNICSSAIQWLIDFSVKNQIPLIIEPVSVVKAAKISSLNLNNVFMITPNEDELKAISSTHDTSIAVQTLLDKGIQQIWLRKGSAGSVMYSNSSTIELEAKKIEVVDSTGAGDAALAGWVSAVMDKHHQLAAMQYGHTLAFEVLQMKGAVMPHINKQSLTNTVNKYYPDAKILTPHTS